MHIFKTLSFLGLSLALGACGTLASGQTQAVTLVTPGANEAECTFDNGVKYRVRTGETLKVMRNEKDIVVECRASGNRYRKMNIESGLNGWALGNVVTGVIPGVTFDHFAKGLYDYPEKITIDFTGQPIRGYELPSYHDKDAPSPYTQSIESYAPGSPRTDDARPQMKIPLSRKTIHDPYKLYLPPASLPAADANLSALPPPASAPLTPSAGASTEDLNRQMNPSVFDK